jgi:hypothetical protein
LEDRVRALIKKTAPPESDSEEEQLQRAIAMSLGQHADSASAAPVVRVADDDNKSINSSVMQAAAQMGMEDKQEALRAQYEAEQEALRQEAATVEQRELEELRRFKAQQEELEELRRYKAAMATGAPAAASAPRRRAGDGVLLGTAASAPRRPPGAGASPAADALVPYAETKRILQNKFRAQIVTPMERELMSARAEISFLSGVLQEGSPEYAAVMQRVHNEFRAEGVTVSAIHTRKKRFDKLPGELRALEDELSRVLEQLSVKRL